MLDEMERALHDALCIVKRTLESNVVVLWRRSLSSPHYLCIWSTLQQLWDLGNRLAIAEFL
ncbi:hypothetical protein MKW92_037239 [Papaver armeniacum]|nr:hypothetical protein MKW92_037239 [Papaver armeniacum]